jgi:hypothetical protein
MNIENALRTLAQSNHYQTLYALFKEAGVSIFENRSNYTFYQIHFLNYLNYFNILFTDIAMQEVDEIVLTDVIYEEAYFAYKNKNQREEVKKLKHPQSEQKEKQISTEKWIFKKRYNKN